MDLSSFFWPLVEEMGSGIAPELRVYVVHVLVDPPNVRPPFGPKIYGERTSVQELAWLGDGILFLSGFYPEYLGQDDYYASLGSLAYARAREDIYSELSRRFVSCRALVRDVRERCDVMGLDTMVALNRWLQNPSKALRTRLLELGIPPVVGRS